MVLSSGCADTAETAPDGGTPNNCAPGLKPMGPACVPIFDECQDDEVPMLGGGCKQVGVKECLDGWGLMGPPDWTCKPIGPPRTCLNGWEKVAGGWCEPILPKTKCPAGTMEVIGKPTCQSIGDCGSGTWGEIITSAKTIFVDQSFTGGSSDGTQAKPYSTIAAALAGATAGDHIAVAAGTYKESVSIERAVTLEGRCAQMVTISKDGGYAAVEMKSSASGAVLRGVTITGSGTGLRVSSLTTTVERVAVQGCESWGIYVRPDSSLTLRYSLVAVSRGVGIGVSSAKATLEGSVVRDTRGQALDQRYGTGVQAVVSSGQTRSSDVVLRSSLVAGNRGLGIYLGSSKAMLDQSVVRDTRERATDSGGGTGILASFQTGQAQGAELVLLKSLVAGNRSEGIAVLSSKITMEHSVVRDTLEQTSDKRFGTGITASVKSSQSVASDVTLRDSLIIGNRNAGVVVLSSRATVERTVVRDTRERDLDRRAGLGFYISTDPQQDQGSELVLHNSLVAGNREVGILINSSKATVERTVVRDTRERISDKAAGTGIQVSVDPYQKRGSEATLRDCLVAGNRNAGIVMSGSKTTVERSVVRDTHKEWIGLYGDGLVVSDKSTLEVMDTVVDHSARAGLLFENSGGSVKRCLVRRNTFAIDLEKGANPTIGKYNRLVENQINDVTSGRGLRSAPLPGLPNPMGSP